MGKKCHCSKKKTYEFLNPSNCFFLFSDNFQSGLLNLVKNIPGNEYKNAVQAYIDIANYYHIPCIVAASAPDSPNGPIITDEYLDLFCPDILHYFPRTGPINIMDYAPAREAIELLKKQGRSKCVINGIATDVCVLFPALTLKSEGYDVYAAVDASGTTTSIAEDAALNQMSQYGVKLTSWFPVACAIQNSWLNKDINSEYATPGNPTGAFEPLLTIVRKHYPEYNYLTWSKYGVPISPIPDPCDK